MTLRVFQSSTASYISQRRMIPEAMRFVDNTRGAPTEMKQAGVCVSVAFALHFAVQLQPVTRRIRSFPPTPGWATKANLWLVCSEHQA